MALSLAHPQHPPDFPNGSYRRNHRVRTHRGEYGVEPICRELPLAPSTYYGRKAWEAHRSRLPPRARRDAELRKHIRRVWEEKFRVYGVRKVWRPLPREGVAVGRCSVARLMRELGIRGLVRGRRVNTTTPVVPLPYPPDRVIPVLRVARSNAPWPANLTYVATWAAFVYVWFVIGAYAPRIVG